MTTKKPSTVTSATGAYAYKSGVSSTATNYIDNTFPNLLDKTGDNATNGGGITGRIDLLNGSTLVVQPGAVIDYNGGGTLVFNGTSGITMNDSSTLQFNNTSTMLMGSSSSLLCGGTLNITSGGTFNLQSTGNMHINNGANLTIDNGGHIALSGGSNMDCASGSNINFNSGSNVIYTTASVTMQNTTVVALETGTTLATVGTAYITIQTGGLLGVSSGGTLNVHGTHKTDVWPSWNTPITRQLIESTTSGISISGTWSGGLQFVFDTGTGGVWAQQLQRTHNGATLAQLFVGLSVGTSHAGVPAVRPSLSLVRYNWTGMFSPQTLSTVDPQYFPNPGSGAAYYDGGNQQFMNYVCNQNNVIDNTNYIYVLTITDESGANSQALNAFGLIALEYQVINDLSWNI